MAQAKDYIPGLGTQFNITPKEIDTEALKAELQEEGLGGDSYTKAEIDTKLGTKANAADVYKKTEVDTKLGTKANSADVYTKTQTDTKLGTKANSADVYTKTQTYTKAEVDKLIDDLRTELGGGGTT